jgi:hypothetical protein
MIRLSEDVETLARRVAAVEQTSVEDAIRRNDCHISDLMLRAARKRGVSKHAPALVAVRSHGSVLRDAR